MHRPPINAPLLFLGGILASATASQSFTAIALSPVAPSWPASMRVGAIQPATPSIVSASASASASAAVFRISRGGGGGVSVPQAAAGDSNNSFSSSAEDDIESAASASGETSSSPGSSKTSNSKMGPKAAPPGLLRRLLPGLPWHRLPNDLTYLRCIAIPALIVLFYAPHVPRRNICNGILFALASFTDWLDGYLARRWDITSPFGAFLDPVADKLMVSTALILLCGQYGRLVAVPTAIILAREIAVSALREWMAQRGLRDSVKVGFQGKVKTAATMVAITMLLLVPGDKAGVLGKLFEPAMGMLFLSALVTVTSGSVYFRAAAPVLMDK